MIDNKSIPGGSNTLDLRAIGISTEKSLTFKALRCVFNKGAFNVCLICDSSFIGETSIDCSSISSCPLFILLYVTSFRGHRYPVVDTWPSYRRICLC